MGENEEWVESNRPFEMTASLPYIFQLQVRAQAINEPSPLQLTVTLHATQHPRHEPNTPEVQARQKPPPKWVTAGQWDEFTSLLQNKHPLRSSRQCHVAQLIPFHRTAIHLKIPHIHIHLLKAAPLRLMHRQRIGISQIVKPIL